MFFSQTYFFKSKFIPCQIWMITICVVECKKAIPKELLKNFIILFLACIIESLQSKWKFISAFHFTARQHFFRTKFDREFTLTKWLYCLLSKISNNNEQIKTSCVRNLNWLIRENKNNSINCISFYTIGVY